jgi:hypothetical protein
MPGLFDTSQLPHCKVFCELGYRKAILEETSPRKIAVPSKLAASLRQKGSETFILVLASNVIAEEEARARNDACPQRQWEEMVEFLENEIETSFPLKRWIHAKNLLRELLQCEDLCISADYRVCFKKDKKKLVSSVNKHFSIVDYLNLATSHSAPG